MLPVSSLLGIKNVKSQAVRRHSHIQYGSAIQSDVIAVLTLCSRPFKQLDKRENISDMSGINSDRLTAGVLIVTSFNEPPRAFNNYTRDQTGIWHKIAVCLLGIRKIRELEWEALEELDNTKKC